MKRPNVLRNCACEIRRYRLLPVTVTFIGTLLVHSQVWSADDIEQEEVTVEYNPLFIHGSGVDVTRFSAGNPVLPGDYDVTVWVNGERRGKEQIRFLVPANQSGAEACLSAVQLTRLGIRIDGEQRETTPPEQHHCAFLQEWVAQSSARYNSGDFELNLRVPQINLVALPQGYIDPSLWESGETAGFIDYSSNVYAQHQGHSSGRSHYYNGNLLMAAGLNYGQWRLRKRFNTNWVSGNSPDTQSLYGYLSRDITSLKSELVIGDTSTTGDLFDSYGLRGVMLRSDERMLPDSLRRYAPVLRGVADTNARVAVRQRGLTIYETVVPPGPFELSDIGTMGWGGDLELVVTEADGRQKIQNIPFAAPPMLLRQGVSNFTLLAGELKEEQSSVKPPVIQGSYRYGVSNLWTLYSGAQIAEKYRAVGVGNAFNTPVGGISFDVMHARSELSNDKRSTGNSYQINYSKYFHATDTNLTLAAYRYSTQGFYTFREAALLRDNRPSSEENRDFRTRHRFNATVSQRMNNNMSLWFSGSLFTYWGNRGDSRQYSVTFNHTLNLISYGVTAMRSRNENGRNENSVLLSLSIPLGTRTRFERPLFSSLYGSASRNNNGSTQFQTQISGSQGEQNALAYGLGMAASHFSPGQSDRSVNGNINYNSGNGQFGATVAANNSNTQQISLSASGSMVAHAGGVTLGPAVGDAPFAIVGAKGAEGARLLNGYGGRVDRFGYAIMPSLTPYRINELQLDTRNLPNTVDVLENERTVVPRQGAAIAVNIKTIRGVPLILTMRNSRGEVLPIGSDVQDGNGVSQGVVGQGGQAFVRGWEPVRQALYAKVDDTTLRCIPHKQGVAIKEADAVQITQLEVVCSHQSKPKDTGTR